MYRQLSTDNCILIVLSFSFLALFIYINISIAFDKYINIISFNLLESLICYKINKFAMGKRKQIYLCVYLLVQEKYQEICKVVY